MGYANPEGRKDYMNSYRQKPGGRAKMKAASSRWYNARKGTKEFVEHRKKVKLMQRYGITLEAFDKMFSSQGFLCAICNKPNWGKRGPCVDHDHENGDVRGLLCYTCNMAIGLIEDDPEVAERMTKYLRRER